MYDGNKSIIAAALLSTLVNLSAGAGPSLNPQLEYQPAEVENSPASGSDRNQPNLTSYTPTGWDLPIVPSSVPGTNTLNTLYGSRDTSFSTGRNCEVAPERLCLKVFRSAG